MSSLAHSPGKQAEGDFWEYPGLPRNSQDYEIDLSAKNAEKFRTTLEPFIEKSRSAERRPALQTAARRRTRRRGDGPSGRDDLPLIRAWAESQGLGVSSRGRIKKEIVDQYDQVHG